MRPTSGVVAPGVRFLRAESPLARAMDVGPGGKPRGPTWILGLYFTVRFEVVFGGVLGGVKMVSLGKVSVMRGGFVVAVIVMLGGFMVMACSVFVMLRCLGVMLGCLAGHGQTPFDSHWIGEFDPQRIIGDGAQGCDYSGANWG
ncbi:MAG: hypothetical protein WAL75_24645 [Terracidiphilus sp.]